MPTSSTRLWPATRSAPAGSIPGISGETRDSINLTNTIVAANTGGNGDQIGGFGSSSATYSDVCLAGGAAPGSHNLCVDPKLVNPGPGHADVHETSASPTIDIGSTALVPSGLSVDYEGDARVTGPAVDIGADEFEPPAPTLPLAGSAGSAPGVPPAVPGAGVLVTLLGVAAAARIRRRQA